MKSNSNNGALLYLQQVKTRRPEAYGQLLQLIRACVDKSLGGMELIAQVKSLFKTDVDLIRGFAQFLPDNERGLLENHVKRVDSRMRLARAKFDLQHCVGTSKNHVTRFDAIRRDFAMVQIEALFEADCYLDAINITTEIRKMRNRKKGLNMKHIESAVVKLAETKSAFDGANIYKAATSNQKWIVKRRLQEVENVEKRFKKKAMLEYQ